MSTAIPLQFHTASPTASPTASSKVSSIALVMGRELYLGVGKLVAEIHGEREGKKKKKEK